MPAFMYIWLFLCLVCVLGFGYNLYQFDRNGEILRIQIKWVKNKDKREKKYSYGYMFDPKLHNWFGLKYPKEEDYK